VQAVVQAQVSPGAGLAGDHFSGGYGRRQVTLIQSEHLSVIAFLCRMERVKPEQLRRNLVISGINLRALYNGRFYVGAVLLEGTGFCQPCSRMEETLGPGGCNAVRSHGGITARVLSGDVVHMGDEVRHYPALSCEDRA
jgi:MOSC domain-containing protein YiiM